MSKSTYTYDPEKDQLQGWVKLPPDTISYGPIILSRDRSFTIYKDYAQYLAEKRITAKTYQNSALQHSCAYSCGNHCSNTAGF